MTFLYVTSAPIVFLRKMFHPSQSKFAFTQQKCKIISSFFVGLYSLKLTDIAPEHRCLEYDRFFLGLGWPIFRGELLLLVSGGQKTKL